MVIREDDPADNHETVSAARIEPLLPDGLGGAQRRIYERIVGGLRSSGPFRLVEESGVLAGPFDLFVQAPSVGEPLSALGEAIRFGTSLDARCREIAILTVAAHRRASYEWYAHARVAQQHGFTAGELAALKAADPDRWAQPSERVVHRAALMLLMDRGLDDATYNDARSHLAVEGLVELVVLLSYYDCLALLLDTFNIGVPAGEDDPFASG